MQTTVISVPTENIFDWDSFHDVFKAALGFPDFYGRNMNAWIDCLTCADDGDAGMMSPTVAGGELLTLRIDDAASFKSRCPDQYDALIDCTSFVNFRRVAVGSEPVLALLLGGNVSSL